MRTRITLACTECKQRNYDDYKNKQNTTERLELKNIAHSAKNIQFTKKLSNF